MNFLDIIKKYITKEIEKNEIRDQIHLDNKKLKEGLIEQLEEQLTPIVINVLFSEYNGFKEYYNLDANESISKYIEKIEESEYFNDLSRYFPVMRDKIDSQLKNFLSFINEINKNLKIHKTKTGYKEIKDIKLALGDTHNNGKTVCFINIDDRDYIYKPRNAQIDINFINFVSKYIKEYKYKIFNYEDFSVHQLITADQFKTKIEDVKKFYYNMGFLSAIFYFLGATDMHYENVIVNGTTPIFVDLETISDITDHEQGKIHNNLLQSFSDSIFQSMIYPFEINENYLNISALTGKEGKVSKFHYTNTKSIINFDGELEFSEENPSLEKQKNEIFLNNDKQLPSFYLSEIVAGFSDFCSTVIEDKEGILEELINIIKNQPIRQVIRPTHIYAKYLSTSLDNYYLKERENVFELLGNLENSKDGRIFNAEFKSLIQGDIPLFYSYYNSRNLYSQDKCVLENYFSTTMRENIQNRILNFDTKKLNHEINNIYSSLLIYHYNHTENKISSKQFSICSSVESSFNFLKDFYTLFQSINNSTSALLPSFLGEKLIISPITPSIYEYGGNLLLIIYFRDELGVSIKKIIDIFKTMKEWKTYNIADMNGFNGIGGYIYLLNNAYIMTGDKWFYDELLIEIINHCDLEKVKINNTDYFTGLAGTITILSEVYLNMQFEIEIKERLEKVLKTYVEFIQENYVELMNNDSKIGLSHGYSGLILALSRYDKITQNVDNQKLINKLVDIEEQYYNRTENNYIDLRSKNYDNFYLCYGIVGILFSRIELFENGYIHLKNDITDKALKLAKSILNNSLDLSNYSYCLCHGIGGFIELFEELNRLGFLNNELYSEVNNRLFSFLENNSLNGLNNNLKYDSFMLGLGGVAYNYLRKQYNIPSILRLKTFNSEKKLKSIFI